VGSRSKRRLLFLNRFSTNTKEYSTINPTLTNQNGWLGKTIRAKNFLKYDKTQSFIKACLKRAKDVNGQFLITVKK
jgi:hypothetical protein